MSVDLRTALTRWQRRLVPDARPRSPRATGSTGPLIAELTAALDPSRVLWGNSEKTLYSRDASTIDGSAPAVVCLPITTAEVQACVRIARRHGRAITPRGAGTGLAGGAIPLDEPVVVVTTKMTAVDIDADQRRAWVGPGVLNLDLTRATTPFGLHYAPDPSSQAACSIGGNIANNSGGPHCLLHGVTSAHVLALEVVMPDGSIAVLGGPDPDPLGYDLRGAFVGSEGTMGIATRILVRLTPNPPAVRTMLADFGSIRDASAAVSAIIAAGILPAALEMMDANCIAAVENWAKAGLPLDAEAVLLVEVDGLPAGTQAAADAVVSVCRAHGARSVRVARDEAERAVLWKARKSAFGAIANLQPNYYLHDCVVPRTKLVSVLEQVNAIAAAHGLMVLNVFHAGDGNLHPLLLFDRRKPGETDRVHSAGKQIIDACVAAGGVLSGEHGIGLEKRDYMPLVFDEIDLEHQHRLRAVFDPDGVCNPMKVLPAGSRCGELHHVPEGAWI